MRLLTIIAVLACFALCYADGINIDAKLNRIACKNAELPQQTGNYIASPNGTAESIVDATMDYNGFPIILETRHQGYWYVIAVSVGQDGIYDTSDDIKSKPVKLK